MNSKYIYTSYIKKKTDEFDTEKFILEVQKRPCIWDFNTKSYNLKCGGNRETKKRAWEEIARILYPNLDELTLEDRQKKTETLPKKWANLRKYYTDEVRKPVNSPFKKRQRRYHHLLTFLDETVYNRRVLRIKEFQNIGKNRVNADSSSDSESGELCIVEDVDELKHLASERADPPVTPALLDNKNNPEPCLEVKRETDHSLDLHDKVTSPKPQMEIKPAKIEIICKNPGMTKLLNENRGPPPINNNFLYFPSAKPVQDSILSQTLTFDHSAEASKKFLLSLLPEFMSLSVRQNLQFRLGIMDLLKDIKTKVKPDAIPKLPNAHIN